MSSGAIAVVLLTILVCTTSIVMPWVGFVGYAGFAILAPRGSGENHLEKPNYRNSFPQ